MREGLCPEVSSDPVGKGGVLLKGAGESPDGLEARKDTRTQVNRRRQDLGTHTCTVADSKLFYPCVVFS